jgi:DNA-binding NtrC family response regulator
MNSQKTLLIIDDEDEIRSFIHDLVTSKLKVDVIEAKNGDEGLTLLLEKSPDAVLADIHMPDMDGIEFASLARAKGAICPIIFCTGQGSKELAIQAVRVSAFDFIEKPFKNDELLLIIENALNG